VMVNGRWGGLQLLGTGNPLDGEGGKVVEGKGEAWGVCICYTMRKGAGSPKI